MINNIEEFKADGSIQNAIKRNKLSKNSTVVYNGQEVDGSVVNLRDQLSGLRNANMDEAIWKKGDAFVVPSAEVLEQALFISTFRGGQAPGITVKLNNGKAKNLYFSTLTKSVQPYNEHMIAIGEAVHSNTAFYDEVAALPGMDNVFDLLVSKTGQTITCTKVEPVTTARFNDDGIPTGFKNAQVPFFTCSQ